MKIFVTGEFTDRQLERLRGAAGQDRLRLHGPFPDEAALPAGFPECEVVFGNPPAHWLPEGRSLRWIQLESVGFGEYRSLDWQELGKRLTMTNLAGFFAEPVAETALAGILALYRGLGRAVQLQSQKVWRGDALRRDLRTLQGKKVVLFGYGSINRRLETLLAPFACDVSAFGRDWEPAELEEALQGADILVCAVPETDATIGLLDARRLGLLKSTAYLVNVGRGSVLCEEALAQALEERRLAGALIDVTLQEPLPETHSFWNCPNLILTQHSSGGTADEIDRKIDVFLENLVRYRSGESLRGKVDFKKGY